MTNSWVIKAGWRDASLTLRDFNQRNKHTLTHTHTNFIAPFYGWGSIASRLEPLRGGSLLFTTKFPEIPGTHFINLGRMTD